MSNSNNVDSNLQERKGNAEPLLECRIESSTYTAILRRKYLRRNWWWLALYAAVCVTMSFFDIRLMIAGLLLLVVVLPMLLALIYFNYALVQESRWSILQKSIAVSADAMTMTFEHPKMSPVTVRWADIEGYEVSQHCLVLDLDSRRYRFVAIPIAAFSNDETRLRQFLSYLRR